MADFESYEWLQRYIRNAACVDRADVSVDTLGVLAEVLPTLRRSVYRADVTAAFLSDLKVPYGTAAKLFAAVSPASVKETAAFLCRPDVPAVDVARIVASERRMTVLLTVAELPGRDIAVYEAVVAAFGKATQKSSPASGTVFDVLLALLTNPDVPLLSKAAAAAAPSVYGWAKRASRAVDTPACYCWEVLKSSEQLQAAAFDGLSLPDSMLLGCASWQGLSTTQLRVVFACLQGCWPGEPDGVTLLYDGSCSPFADFVDPYRLSDVLLTICDHVAAIDEFLTEVDDWFDEYQFPDLLSRLDDPDTFFWFTYRKHRRQGHRHVDPTEFWWYHPQGPLVELTRLGWSYWTRIPSVPALVEVLAEKPAVPAATNPPDWSSWLVSPLTPLMASASSAELLAGLDAAAATGMPDVLTAVEELCWVSASYEALTFDVLRRLRQSLSLSLSAESAARLLELLAATLGPDPALWLVFDKISTPDASIGEILDLASQILEPGSP